MAQTSPTSSGNMNMTTPMMESASFQLKAAELSASTWSCVKQDFKGRIDQSHVVRKCNQINPNWIDSSKSTQLLLLLCTQFFMANLKNNMV